MGIPTLACGLEYNALRRKMPRVHLVPLNVGFRSVTALDPLPPPRHVAERHTRITTAAGDTVAPYDVGARDGSASDACAGKSKVPIVS